MTHRDNDSVHGITTYQAGIIEANVHRELQKQCDLYLKPFGITKMHWIIVGTILDAGENGIRITELASILDTGLPYLTTTINTLEAKKVLTRSSHDRDGRSKVVFVHDKFAELCPEIEATLRMKLRESVYAKVSPEEFEVYMRVLMKLASPE